MVSGKRKVGLTLEDTEDVSEQKKKEGADMLVASQIGGFMCLVFVR